MLLFEPGAGLTLQRDPQAAGLGQDRLQVRDHPVIVRATADGFSFSNSWTTNLTMLPFRRPLASTPAGTVETVGT